MCFGGGCGIRTHVGLLPITHNNTKNPSISVLNCIDLTQQISMEKASCFITLLKVNIIIYESNPKAIRIRNHNIYNNPKNEYCYRNKLFHIFLCYTFNN